MSTKILGYNVALKPQGKTILGVTQDDFSIATRMKESLTKADKGNTQRTITGRDFTFTVAGLMSLKGQDDEPASLDRDDIIALTALVGTQAVIPFVYAAEGMKSYEGSCVITGYSESTNSEDEGSFTLNLQSSGALKEVANP